MQKLKIILTFTSIALILSLLLVANFFLNRVSPNESTQTGNTAGNLNNKGLYCESNGIVYFSNPYDHNVLYSMNPDETNLKRLNDVGVSSINADYKRIYYSQTGSADGSGLGYIRNTTGMYHCNLSGDRTYCYTKDPVGILALCGNNLYFQHYEVETGAYLDVTPIGNKEFTPLMYSMVTPASISGTTIYYAGNDSDHYLYALDTVTNTSTLVWEKPIWNPVYQDGYIYFMDLQSNYELHRYNLSSGEEQVLSDDRIDFFNVYGNVIYYQKSSANAPALKRINIDGSNDEIIKKGVFESVNITSQYAYFNEFSKKTPVYHQSTFGPVSPEIWMPVGSNK